MQVIKYICLLSLTLLLKPDFSSAQVQRVHFDYCKKQDMDIITGDSLPDGFVVVLTGHFKKKNIGNSISELSKRQIRWMKRNAKWRHACLIFIDFKQIEEFKVPELYNDKMALKHKKLKESRVHFYILAPVTDIYQKEGKSLVDL